MKRQALLAAAIATVAVQAPRGLAGSRRTIDALGASISGRAGVAAVVVETGESVMLHGDERFPMQSVYKLPIAMAVLRQVDAEKLKLSQVVHLAKADLVPRVHSPIRDQNPAGTDLTVRELLRAAIVESDGTASDMLLRLAPPAGVTRMLRTLGIDSMVVATTEREMSTDASVQYRNWSTPRAAMQLLRVLQQGRAVSGTSRILLLGWMTESNVGARRIGGLLPKGTVVAHKTGTDETRKGVTRATNDIGLVTLPGGRHLALAVFLKDSKADETRREQTIARIARAAWDAATPRKRTR